MRNTGHALACRALSQTFQPPWTRPNFKEEVEMSFEYLYGDSRDHDKYFQFFLNYDWGQILRAFDLLRSFKQRSTGVLVGLCPFHNERRPSMHLYPNTRHYHCYGCGAEGDTIDFIKEFKDIKEDEFDNFFKTLASGPGIVSDTQSSLFSEIEVGLYCNWKPNPPKKEIVHQDFDDDIPF